MTQKFSNFKPCDPHAIKVPSNLSADEHEVEKVISSFQTDGNIPDIIISESGELIEGIAALESAIRLEQKIVMVQVASSTKPQINIEWIPVELIDPHPINAQIYGESEDVTTLAESIATNGLQEIFTLKREGERYTIIHGHRRRLACLKAGIKTVPAKLKNFSTTEDELAALLSGNQYREKSIEQKSREYLVWLEIEKERAKSRQGRSGEGQGTTRDIIAKLVGLGSGVNAEHAIACVKALDETNGAPEGSVRHQQHQQLKQLLSRTRGVDAAYKLIKPELPPPFNQTKRWIPKILDKVKIIAGPHKGAAATVRAITGISAICHIDGTPEEKRHQIAFNQMEALSVAPTSVTQELKQKQKESGLRGREQLLPDKNRNEGFNTAEQPALLLTLTSDEIAVAEIAEKILKLSTKQLYEVMCKIEPKLDTASLNAIWKALEKSLAHKAA